MNDVKLLWMTKLKNTLLNSEYFKLTQQNKEMVRKAFYDLANSFTHTEITKTINTNLDTFIEVVPCVNFFPNGTYTNEKKVVYVQNGEIEVCEKIN